MPDGEGGISNFVIDNTVPAHNNKDFMTGFSHMLLSSRKKSEWSNSHEFPMIREAAKQNEVTCKELYNAFWKAYSDQYTPASGIEWRHLWKHIEKMRLGRDRQLYTYNEMLNICDKEMIDTDHFEPVKDEDEKVKGWKRK